MSAPCSRCDCADFRGEPGADFCLACWHPRGVHHLLVCPECGATIEPVRIPLEAASIGEGWVGRLPQPVVHAEQQALWESGAPLQEAVPGADDDTPVTPIPAIVEPTASAQDGGPEGGEEASPAPAATGPEEPAAKGAVEPEAPRKRRPRLRRHVKS